MADEYLATGFTHVDLAADKDFYASCLSLLDTLPYYQAVKRRSYELLDLTPDVTVLDAGCGLGHDVFRIAERLRSGGRVWGMDGSGELIAKARADARYARLPVRLHRGDVKAIPFKDHSFARCRIDRVLQHVPQPEVAIAELVRVLEPGGLLLAYDNDWNTFEVNSPSGNRKTTRKLETVWRESFVNSRIGKDLEALFADAGLTKVQAIPSTSVIDDFEVADKVYNFRATVRKAVASGDIDEDMGTDWVRETVESSARGAFEVALTAYMVVGRR